MKLTIGVNFTNILRAAFLYKIASFHFLEFKKKFWQKNIGKKAPRKMLVKIDLR